MTRGRGNLLQLWKIWKEIEGQGGDEVGRWLDGAETEEEWGDLMDHLLKWGEEHGI